MNRGDHVRRDVWSVKQWDYALGAYCHVRMFYSAESAFRYRRENPAPLTKVVHPADWVVAGFVAAGNKIES